MIVVMSNKKKRSSKSTKQRKQYKGSVQARPTITKVSAVHRHPIHQWWLDHKRVAKPAAIVAGIVFAIVVILVGIISIIW